MAPPVTEGEDTLREHVEPKLASGHRVGDYVVNHVLGEGGFGTVYAATHPLIGKRAAVKVLNAELSRDKEMVSRFVTEARAVNTIRHQNIVDIFNIGQLPDGRHYFVMELLDGESFEDVLVRKVRLDPEGLLSIMRGVGSALDAAHSKGIVHRDIKPDNIFLHRDPNGAMVPKLVDFGVAKLTGDAEKMSHHQTATGAPIGTPRYMAPEQCFAKDIDARTDIYALGVVCFEALTGFAPFDADSLLVLMNKHTLADRPIASQMCPALGTTFDSVLQRMMAIDPDERPQSAGEAIGALEAAWSGRGRAAATQRYGSVPNTPTNIMMNPEGTGPHPQATGPHAPIRQDGSWDSAITLATPAHGMPAAPSGAMPAYTQPGHPLSARKPTTLAATSSGVKKQQRGQMLVYLVAGVLALSVIGIVGAFALTSETTPVAETTAETEGTPAATGDGDPTSEPTPGPTSDPMTNPTGTPSADASAAPSAEASAEATATPSASASAKKPAPRRRSYRRRPPPVVPKPGPRDPFASP